MSDSILGQLRSLIQAGDSQGITNLVAQIDAERLTAQKHLADFDKPAASAGAIRLKFPEPPKPEFFWGMDSKPPTVGTWLFQLNTLFKFWNMTDTDRLKYAILFLRGWAQTWWQQCEAMAACNTLTPIQTWEQFQSAIRRQFGGFDEVEKARDDLARVRQTASVMAYVHRFHEAMLKLPADQIVDADLRHRFISGLKPNTQLQVKIANPTTLQEAMNVADRIDRVRPTWRPNVPGRTSRPINAHAFSDGPVPMELGAMKSKPVAFAPKPSKFPPASAEKPALPNSDKIITKPLSDAQRRFLYQNDGCYYCRKPHAGHISRNCPAKLQYSSNVQTPSRPSNRKAQ